MSHHINLTRIKAVYNALGMLQDQVVFVGGATVSLYVENPEQSDIRPTEDIDVLVEVGTYNAYTKVQEQLFQLGFQLDTSSKVICRYLYKGLIVDVMPIEEEVLGFSNKWYKEGFDKRVIYKIDGHTEINIFTAPYFIASKLEAFKGRGKKDGRTSQDFEDIIFVLDNRKKIWDEIKNANQLLQEYLKDQFQELLSNRNIKEWISAHLEHQTATERANMILEAMEKFIS